MTLAAEPEQRAFTIESIVEEYLITNPDENIEVIQQYVIDQLRMLDKEDIIRLVTPAVRDVTRGHTRLLVLRSERTHDRRVAVVQATNAQLAVERDDPTIAAIDPLLSWSVWEPLAHEWVVVPGTGVAKFWIDLTEEDLQARIDYYENVITGLRKSMDRCRQARDFLRRTGATSIRDARDRGIIT